jgi:hypothetical protein
MMLVNFADFMFASIVDNLPVIHVKPDDRAPHWNSQVAQVQLTRVMELVSSLLRLEGVLVLHHYGNSVDTTRIICIAICTSLFFKNVNFWNYKQVIPTTIGKEETVRALTLGFAFHYCCCPP